MEASWKCLDTECWCKDATFPTIGNYWISRKDVGKTMDKIIIYHIEIDHDDEHHDIYCQSPCGQHGDRIHSNGTTSYLNSRRKSIFMVKYSLFIKDEI